MHKVKILLAIAIFALLVTPVMANEMAKSANISGQGIARDMTEGFEGVWPPEGWTVNSVSGHTDYENWHQGTSFYTGAYAANCEWDPDLVPQDNTLSFDYSFGTGALSMDFWIAGSAYWSTNYDVTVEVNGTELYSWAETYGDENWVWENHEIDLSAYAGQTVTITFRYTGVDGAAIYLDDITVMGDLIPTEQMTVSGVKALY